MGKIINATKRISRAVVEFMSAFDERVAIDLNHVEYIKEDEGIVGESGTLIYFTSGNNVFVEEKYDSVRDMLNAFRMGNDTGIEE